MINKQFILSDSESFVLNEHITLKIMESKFKTDFIRTLGPVKWTKCSTEIEQFHEEVWKELNNDTNITFSILSPQTGEYMGYCQYKNITTSKPDIGIELLPEYRGRGIGYVVCAALIDMVFERTDLAEIFYKLERSNTASMALVEKLGGKRSSTRHTWEQLLSALRSMTDEELRTLPEKNAAALAEALERYGEELSEKEYPTDILIYAIEKDEWQRKRTS